MKYLIAVTILWAFSFSLIGVYLAGQVDAYFAVLLRVALALLLFLPFLRPQPLTFALKLIALGAVQLGLMYLFYYQSFLLLSVPEVLVFTIFTPVYITLLYDVLQRRFHYRYLLAAMVAVLAAAMMRYQGLTSDYWLGFAVVQGANLCFAIGQVGYKLLLARQPATLPQHQIFAWFYLGALLIALPAWLLLGVAIGSSVLVYRGLYPLLIAFNSVPKVAVVKVGYSLVVRYLNKLGLTIRTCLALTCLPPLRRIDRN